MCSSTSALIFVRYPHHKSWLFALAGVSYDSNGKSVTGRFPDPILEVSSSAGEKQAADDYINLLSMAEETETVTSKFMMDVTGVQ